MYTILTKTCKILHVDITKYCAVTYFIAVGFKEILCQLCEDGEIIAPKTIGSM